jgi:tetratricopeptide (TPR) repeat protein
MRKKVTSSQVLTALLLFCSCLFLALPREAWGQYGTDQRSLRANDVEQQNNCDYRSLELAIYSDPKAKVPLDRQSVARLYDKARKVENWKTATEDSKLTFCVDVGDYDLDVSAVGYVTDHRAVRVDGTLYNNKIPIILQKDPEAVDLDASESDLPPNVRRDVKSAATSIKNGNFKDAQKKLERAYQVAPSTIQVNYLLGYLFLQLKDWDKSETYLRRAATLDPRRSDVLTMLGRLLLERNKYSDAQKVLEQAVDANGGYWMAHYLLGDTYLRLKEYEKARQQAQQAIDTSKGTGSIAQLVLGQALADLGHNAEGVQALNTFVRTNPNNPAVGQVKSLIADIEKRESGESTIAGARAVEDLALTAAQPSLPPSAWGPPGVDDIRPPVATGVPCPYNEVMEKSGERVKELVDSIAQFAATEDLLHEKLDPTGKALTRVDRKFDYSASISEAVPGYLRVDEFRNERYGISDLPDRIVTSGFMSLALIFHPDMRENYQMMCEGLGDWHGQATWIVYFRQRTDKPNRLADLVVGSNTYPINLKGRAWITADTFQIVRIESELMNPIPVLAVQHQIAEYGPVHFQKKNVDLWLPHSVDLFFELNRHRYYRRHSFDHYMLFAVNSEDKQLPPKESPPGTTVKNR